MAKGMASAEEKAQVQALYKELDTEQQETVKEDVEAVDALPTEEAGADDEAVKSIVKTLETKIKEEVSGAQKAMEKDLAEWKKSQENGNAVKQNSLDVLLTEKGIQTFAKNVKSEKGSIQVELKDFDFRAKAAADISGLNLTGSVSRSELEAGVSRAAQRQPFIEQLVSVGTINAPIDVWIETTGEEGDPLPVAELAAMPQKDWDFAERTAPVRKVAVYSKYSAEMAEDLPNLVSEIRNYLVADLRRVVDTQILSGAGTGENLTGILTNATAFAAGTLVVDEPNNFDVIEAAVTQVLTNLFNPNYVVVHPVDAAKMNLTKGTDGHYVMPPFITAGGQTISGVRVVTNTGVTAGSFLVGDFTRSSVKYRRGLTVELTNSDQDDFIKDRFTVKATVRLVHRVKANDYGAFVKGTFAAAIADLTA